MAIHFVQILAQLLMDTEHSVIAKVLYLKIPADSITLVVLSQKEIARRGTTNSLASFGLHGL